MAPSLPWVKGHFRVFRQLNGSALHMCKEKSCQEKTNPCLAVIRAGETKALLSPGEIFPERGAPCV